MDRKRLRALLTEKKVQDYSFSIFFFIVFSFFLAFAIRPNVITAFNLQQELQDLKLKNREYEAQILQIVNYQSVLETYRNDLPVLDEAIPSSPQVAKVVEDVQNAALQADVPITSVTVESINFKQVETVQGIQAYKITLDTEASASSLEQLILAISNQRRIKTIDQFALEGEQASTSGAFTVNMIVSAYYL
ncbi:MAG: type 4a pilus biogenesis protein PilO [Weeksellaceae bacterium]